MPRTTYSDFSLPNFQRDCQHEKRSLSKRKNQIQKKKSRNIAKPNRQKRRTQKLKFKKGFKHNGAFSPEHKRECFDQDSASFQSDCIDNRLENGSPAFDRAEQTLPFLDEECELAVNRLVEESQRKQLISIMQGCCLSDKESLKAQ